MSTLLSNLNPFASSASSTQHPAKPIVFRGKLSKVLRLSMRDLPSFSQKSPATMSMLHLTPNNSISTETALNYVKNLLLQASQALQQNQATIRTLMSERDKLQQDLSSRPSSDEFVLVQEQLQSQRELSRMDRVQIKQLQLLSEQQESIIVQNEQRMHQSNHVKNELIFKIRNLVAAQNEAQSHNNSLERQLQFSKQELSRLSEELRCKADDIRSYHERLQASMNAHQTKCFAEGQSEQDDEGVAIIQQLYQMATGSLSSRSLSEMGSEIASSLNGVSKEGEAVVMIQHLYQTATGSSLPVPLSEMGDKIISSIKGHAKDMTYPADMGSVLAEIFASFPLSSRAVSVQALLDMNQEIFISKNSPQGFFVPKDFLKLYQPDGAIHTPEQLVEVIEHRLINQCSRRDLNRLRAMIDSTNTLSDREVIDHLEHRLKQLDKKSVEETKTIERLYYLIPDNFVSSSTDLRVVLEEFICQAEVSLSKSLLNRLCRHVPKEILEAKSSPEEILDSLDCFLVEREDTRLHLHQLLKERESDVAALTDLLSQSNSTLDHHRVGISSSRDSQIEENQGEQECLESRRNSVQDQLDRPLGQDGRCLGCIAKKRLLKDLEEQLFSAAKEFDLFELQMAKLRSKTSRQTSTLKSKDIFIAQLQKQIHVENTCGRSP